MQPLTDKYPLWGAVVHLFALTGLFTFAPLTIGVNTFAREGKLMNCENLQCKVMIIILFGWWYLFYLASLSLPWRGEGWRCFCPRATRHGVVGRCSVLVFTFILGVVSEWICALWLHLRSRSSTKLKNLRNWIPPAISSLFLLQLVFEGNMQINEINSLKSIFQPKRLCKRVSKQWVVLPREMQAPLFR